MEDQALLFKQEDRCRTGFFYGFLLFSLLLVANNLAGIIVSALYEEGFLLITIFAFLMVFSIGLDILGLLDDTPFRRALTCCFMILILVTSIGFITESYEFNKGIWFLLLTNIEIVPMTGFFWFFFIR